MNAWSASSTRLRLTVGAGVLAWLVALIVSLQPGWTLDNSRYLPFYHLQAQSLMEGRADIVFPPGWWAQDSITFNEKQYLAMGPLNGFLTVPFAYFGLSERVFTLTMFAFLLMALGRFVYAHVEWRSKWDGPLWILFFTLGTDVLLCVSTATAWFSATLTGCLFVGAGGLFFLESRRARDLRQDLWLSAMFFCFALAALSRYHLALLFPVFAVVLARQRPLRLRRILWLALPVIFYAAFLGWWNWTRFGDPLSLKYTEHHFAGQFQKWVDAYGFTNIRYVLPHIYAGLVGFPKLLPGFPFLDFDDNGNGIFAMSPLFLFLIFRAPRFGRAEWLALICCVVIFIPVFTHFSMGWRQFGYRYGLDILPFLAFLLTRAQFKITSALALVLIAVSLLMNIGATLMFTA